MTPSLFGCLFLCLSDCNILIVWGFFVENIAPSQQDNNNIRLTAI